MKNIIKGALLLLMVAGLASCDLNKYPTNAIPEDDGFVSFNDATEFRTGIYNFARGCFPPDAALAPGFQAEGINPTKDYGHFYGFQYDWSFQDNDDKVEGLWTASYTALYQINYFLEKVEELDTEGLTEAQLNQLEIYKAEAHFFRAMINNQLAVFYCKDYEPETAQSDLGIIITKKADIFAREKRSTLFETYEFINEDIAFAEGVFENATFPSDYSVYYINTWTIKALKAKVLLNMHQYTEAAELSVSIVNQYTLIDTEAAFKTLWTKDEGSEIVFQFFANLNEGAYPYGDMFLRDTYGTGGSLLNPAYIPDQWLLDQYVTSDIRYKVFFQKKNVRIGLGIYNLFLLTKYPGNPAYDTSPSVTEMKHNIRPYRSADFCLMAAEAYAMAGDLGGANANLKKLLDARIPGNEYTNYSSIEEILPIIKLERLKELFMETNRIGDLKRWGDPMSRFAHDPQNLETVTDLTHIDMVIEPTDKRFVWPIPQSEQNSNPSIKGQLNWN